jgi:hypothetical protein
LETEEIARPSKAGSPDQPTDKPRTKKF